MDTIRLSPAQLTALRFLAKQPDGHWETGRRIPFPTAHRLHALGLVVLTTTRTRYPVKVSRARAWGGSFYVYRDGTHTTVEITPAGRLVVETTNG